MNITFNVKVFISVAFLFGENFKLKKMTRLLLLLSFSLFFLVVSAQKKEISQAKDYIKGRENLEKAESLMRGLLLDTANRRNIKIHAILAEALRLQYEKANEKFYLKEKTDTSSFFNVTRRMFLAYETLDSVDAMPDKKGHVKIKFRKKNAQYLSKCRRNLYNGGLFFLRHKDFSSAYDLMDTYLDCRIQPLFSDYKDTPGDSITYSSAAFCAIYSSYKLNRPDSALKYKDLSLGNIKYRKRTLQYLAEIYMQKRDTSNYLNVLKVGFKENRKSEFFFIRLMDYYNGKNHLDSALSIADSALVADKDNELYLFAKSNILLNMGKYKDCISISDTLLSRKSEIFDVYYNAGVSYINMALLLENDIASRKKNRKKIIGYYKKSLPYMEKYRQLRPDDKQKWATSLYNIYLKLNMGRQFEEMSNILLKMQK